MIHISAIERFGQVCPHRLEKCKSIGRNLLNYMSAYVEVKEEENRKKTGTEKQKVERIPVVGWNGLPLDEKMKLTSSNAP